MSRSIPQLETHGVPKEVARKLHQLATDFADRTSDGSPRNHASIERAEQDRLLGIWKAYKT